MKKNLSKMGGWLARHKFVAALIVLVIVGGGYYTYKKVKAANVVPQYTLMPARRGTIMQTITGSGQVSSENQLDITSEVSGKITSISASVGQVVKAGDLIATLDSHDALVDLENSKIAYEKLTQPAKTGDIINSQNSLTKSYSDTVSAISDSFLHVPSIMSGLKDMLYSNGGYLSDVQNVNLTETGKNYRKVAATNFDKANNDYAIILEDYKSLTKTSTPDEVEVFLSRTMIFVKEVSETLKNTQAAITFITVSQPEYNSNVAAAAATSVSTWSSQVNGDLSSLLSNKNSIDNNKDALNKLKEGADTLDIQSSNLSLQQKEREYSKYFVRAPFEGIVGKIPVHVYDQAGSGTVIATLSSSQKITNIPLNEVDAVKVAKGDKVTLTFDAITGLKVDGTVSQIDLVGTASQGVVTYNVKISFDGTDSRILPGMSVDATITTKETDDVVVVPTTAIKTQGRNSYVETFDNIPANTNTNTYGQNASTTGQRFSRPITISSKTPPRQLPVTIGDSDDTNTEIVSGLDEGQQIVVRTVSTGATVAKTPAPNIFSSFGAGGGGAGGGAQRNAARNLAR